LVEAGVSPKIFFYMVIRENWFNIYFIAGTRATCYYKGQTHGSAPTSRHMGLPLPEIIIYHYIIWEMLN